MTEKAEIRCDFFWGRAEGSSAGEENVKHQPVLSFAV